MWQSKVISICGAFLILSSAVFAGPPMAIMVPGDSPTIQGAIDFANDGDTVVVSQGTYNENIDFGGKNITVTSMYPGDPAMTVIDAGGSGSVVTFTNGEGPGAVLRGFTITGGYGTVDESSANAVLGAGIYCDNASPTIVDNVITGNHAPTDEATAAGIGCGIFCRASEAVITRNIITENTGYGGGAIAVYVCDVVMTNNLIYNNEATYIGGLYLAYGGQLVNNTIVGNEATDMGGNVCALGDATAGRFLIKNNIICNAGASGGIHVEGGPADYEAITYNNVWNNTGGNYDNLPDQIGLNGNISQDPGFGLNYHISAGSPCYDAGDPDFVPWLWQRDIDGEPAVMDARVDIGADEVTGNARPVADAGADQYFDTIPAVVILNGSGSYDADGGVLAYEWSQTGGPGVTLANEDTAQSSFVPPEENVYSFELIVNDGTYSSNTDSVIIVVGNRSPVADAGDDQFGEPGAHFTLNGLGSYDPDENDVLTYNWSRLSGPAVELTDADSASPWFEPVMEGEYVFELVVSDGTTQSEPDTVTVLVQIGSEPDAYGYRWIDSDSSWGPQYHWIDIQDSGTAVTGLSDDNYQGPFPIGFDFNFYGNIYDEFYVQSNGAITFEPYTLSFNNSPIPQADGQENVIAFLWDDLTGTGSNVYYKGYPGYTVIQFANYRHLGTGSFNAEIILYDSGRIVFQYKDFSDDFYRYWCAVGIENFDGTIGTQVAYQEVYLHEELAVEFSLGPPYQPVADAGPDQFLSAIGEVVLDGSGSYDRDPCDVLTYQWAQTAGPAVELSDATAVQPTFMPEVEGEYRFELVVSDGVLTSYPDEVMIVVGNRSPVADAGPDKISRVDEQVQLNGSGSYDPDYNPLTYTWTQLAGPAVDLQDPCTATPYFDCTEEGVYEFELVVSDGLDESEADTVQVVVVNIIIEQEELYVAFDTAEHDNEIDYFHYPDVSGSKVVYGVGCCCDYSWDIYCKDLKTNELNRHSCRLGSEHGQILAIDTQPKIDGDILVYFGDLLWPTWGHEPANTGILAENLSTGEKIDLRQRGNFESYSHPVVSGSKVVWLEHLNVDPLPKGSNEANNWWDTPYNICGADITDFDEPEYFTIAENVGSRDPYPCHTYGEDFDDVIDICGDIAVWEAGGDIYGADISDLDNIEVFTICNDPGRQFDPAISGSVVIWTDERSDAGDIYGADISNVEEIEVFEVVKESGNQQQPAIDRGLIVYVDGGLYGGQIRARYLIRQFHGVFEIPLLGLPYGCGPSVDGSIIVWQDSTYGEAQGLSVEVSYSIFDGPVENTTSGKRHDYIQHAINFADYGDIIVAGSGVYHENINFKGKSVVLTSGGSDRSDEAADAVIQGDGTCSVVTFAGTKDPNCQLVGFTITGGEAVNGGGIFGGWATPTISRCVIRNNTSVRHGGGIYAAHGIIEGCTIFENTAGSGGGGIASCHGTISSCLIYNNNAGYHGAMSNCDGDIINCTVTNNTSTISPGGLGGCDGRIINCIIWGNYHDQLLNCSEPTYSCIQDWTGGGICNIATDPEFVDANSAIPLEGMDAYWMFDRDPNDSSPNSHNGNLFGDAGFVQDPDRGQVLILDGDGDYVEMTGYKGITGKNPRAFSAWVKTDMTTIGGIVTWGGNGAGQKWLLIMLSSGEVRLSVASGSISGTTAINDGQWHHVTVVWEEDFGPYVRDVKLYIDGVAEGAGSSLRKIDTGSEIDVAIGYAPGWGIYFDGLLDEVAVWDKALSGAEISILYERGLRGEGYLRVEGDFHLLADSPCIDAADNLAVATNADVDGNARILDGNNDGDSVVDMGACEFVYPNIRPVADAGEDQTVFAWIDEIAEVTLDGSGSYDDDGDELTYAWFIDGEGIATGVNPTVELEVGEHIIELIVNDGVEDSEPNAVVINVIAPIEADVHIVPRVINRNNRLKRVMAVIRLPAGIGKGDVVCESFELYAGGLDGEPVGAILERVIGWGNMTRVFALFDEDELMDAVEGVGRVELTVVGRLESGQYIQGSDTVRIVQPRRRRARGLHRRWR